MNPMERCAFCEEFVPRGERWRFGVEAPNRTGTKVTLCKECGKKEKMLILAVKAAMEEK